MSGFKKDDVVVCVNAEGVSSLLVEHQSYVVTDGSGGGLLLRGFNRQFSAERFRRQTFAESLPEKSLRAHVPLEEQPPSTAFDKAVQTAFGAIDAVRDAANEQAAEHLAEVGRLRALADEQAEALIEMTRKFVEAEQLLLAEQRSQPQPSPPSESSRNLDFADVLKKAKTSAALQGSDAVRFQRAGWNGRGQYISLYVPDEDSKMDVPYFYIRPVDGKKAPWLCSVTDMFAEDWSVYLGDK